jgi:hypothetical protein
MGARGKYGESKRDGKAVLEGNGWVAKGEEEESEIEEGMGSKFLLFGKEISFLEKEYFVLVSFSVVAEKLETPFCFIRIVKRCR